MISRQTRQRQKRKRNNQLKENTQFKNEFQRNVSIHAIDRIKKEILTKTQVNSQSNLSKPKQQKKKPGQKRMTSEKEDKIIIKSIENNNRKSWEQISKLLIEEYQIDVSKYTVSRRAKEELIKGYVPLEKPLLNNEKAKKRLEYAKRIMQALKKNKYYLNVMVFTDETKLRLFENETGGNVYVKCKKQRDSKVKISVVQLNMEEVLVLMHVEQNYLYLRIIQMGNSMIQKYQQSLKVKDAMIVEDLDPKHSLLCKVSEKEAQKQGYHIVQDYPHSSPDLNPIENVWGLLKTAIS